MQIAVLATLTLPVILFFVLGLLVALARFDLAISELWARSFSIHLMIVIRLKGGATLTKSGFGPDPPLQRLVTDAIDDAGIQSRSIITLGTDKGHRGDWRDDRLTSPTRLLIVIIAA